MKVLICEHELQAIYEALSFKPANIRKELVKRRALTIAFFQLHEDVIKMLPESLQNYNDFKKEITA